MAIWAAESARCGWPLLTGDRSRGTWAQRAGGLDGDINAPSQLGAPLGEAGPVAHCILAARCKAGWKEGRERRTGEEEGGSTDSPGTYCVLGSVPGTCPRPRGVVPSTLPDAHMGHPCIHWPKHVLNCCLWLALCRGYSSEHNRQKPPSLRVCTITGDTESE